MLKLSLPPPKSNPDFHALLAEEMVRASQGLGGPQPSEVTRMLAAQRDALTADQVWTQTARDRLAQAALQRDTAFAAVQGGGR